MVTDWDGKTIDLSWRGQVVAAGDPRRHREVLALLAEGA
jgi:fructose-1,6-bisphosphatase/inositol monophosphatase family enzyme